ncbi:5'/3'-nucleotidase SurE [Archaeoglobales archaeon]|nr:MAG: 5'/3'-nucleotidase SurE [Archaeoglobales archaeon]RLI79190.1 MAG: 5'/3'-nucleotidase SurE [Archaeoglobales archaeon]
MAPKILITNDDGLYSAGLKASYEALRGLGEIYVVAPAVQKSGVGRSMSIMEPIRVSEVNVNGIKVYAVDGTPTDAVIIGIHEVIGEVPNITISGINLGENLSTEAVTTSGTVCAALEAATQGSNAIAISMELPDVEKFELFFKPYDFGFAKEILRSIARVVLKKGMPMGVDVLNVNVPSKPNGEVEVTRLAKKMYKTRIEKRYDPRGRKYYWISGVERKEAEKDTDIHALKNGKVSITPLSIDLTANVDFDVIRSWFE